MDKEMNLIEYHPGIFDEFKMQDDLDKWIIYDFKKIMLGLGYEEDSGKSFEDFKNQSTLNVKLANNSKEEKKNILYLLEHADKQIVGNYLFSHFKYLTHSVKSYDKYDVDFLKRIIRILEDCYPKKEKHETIDDYSKRIGFPEMELYFKEGSYVYYIVKNAHEGAEGVPSMIFEDLYTNTFEVCDSDAVFLVMDKKNSSENLADSHLDYLGKELERTIYNWNLEGEDAVPNPMFSVLKFGYDNGMDFIVPIETPFEMLQMVGNFDNIMEGDTFTSDEDIGISFRHLVVNEEGEYFIPLFTSKAEVDKGEPTSTINQPLKSLFDAVDDWNACLGYIVNPWGQEIYLDKNTIHMLKDYNKTAFIDIVKGRVEDLHVSAVVKIKEECDDSYSNENVDDIIYVDKPYYDEDEEDDEERVGCYEIELEILFYSALDDSFENGNGSIAFSCNKCEHGFPFEVAAKNSLDQIVAWLEEHIGMLKNVYICCDTDEEYDTYMRLITPH